jgi:hypothetical protein
MKMVPPLTWFAEGYLVSPVGGWLDKWKVSKPQGSEVIATACKGQLLELAFFTSNFTLFQFY